MSMKVKYIKLYITKFIKDKLKINRDNMINNLRIIKIIQVDKKINKSLRKQTYGCC